MSAQIAPTVSAEPFLSRLQGVMRQGAGWRAKCPAHKGVGRTLSVAEADDRVLIHCFAGCKAADVLTAVGMTWADIQPPKHWPQTKEERRRAQRLMREVGLLAAFDVLYREAQVLAIASRQMRAGVPLNDADAARLELAVDRVSQAVIHLRDFEAWNRRNP